MKWTIIIGAILILLIIWSVVGPEEENTNGWYVKYFEKTNFQPYKVYCDGEWQAAFETLEEAKQYIEEHKKQDDDEDNPGKIVYRG